jgi:hypothetical protein
LCLTARSGGGSANWRPACSPSRGEPTCMAMVMQIECSPLLPSLKEGHTYTLALSSTPNHLPPPPPPPTHPPPSFKLYVSEVFGAKADLLLERLAAACPGGDPGAAARLGVAPGAAVDLQDLLYRFTLDTFARIGGRRAVKGLSYFSPFSWPHAARAASRGAAKTRRGPSFVARLASGGWLLADGIRRLAACQSICLSLTLAANHSHVSWLRIAHMVHPSASPHPRLWRRPRLPDSPRPPGVCRGVRPRPAHHQRSLLDPAVAADRGAGAPPLWRGVPRLGGRQWWGREGWGHEGGASVAAGRGAGDCRLRDITGTGAAARTTVGAVWWEH